MERSEQEIAEGILASAPSPSPQLRVRILDATSAARPRKARGGWAFAVGWASTAACLVCLQVFVIGGLSDQQQALMSISSAPTVSTVALRQPPQGSYTLLAVLAERTRFLSTLLSDIAKSDSTPIERNGHVTI